MVSRASALKRLDESIQAFMAATNLPGLAIAITDRHDLIHAAGYGDASIEQRIPVSPESTFEIGSISKSFTAILCLQQAQAGRLDLDTPVREYLDWFDVPSPFADITVHHLLSHTAGITRGTDFAPSSRAEVWALRQTPAAYPPGERFHYSNVGYKALGYLLEDLLERPYSEILRNGILESLGMTSTDPIITYATRERMATGHASYYRDRPNTPPYRLMPSSWHEYAAGDGSIASNVVDMTHYTRMLLSRGRGPNGSVLSPDSFARLIHPVVPIGRTSAQGEPWFYGYGLETLQHGDRTLIGHGGSTLGFRAALLVDLADGIGIVVLANGPSELSIIGEAALALITNSGDVGWLRRLETIQDPGRATSALAYTGIYRDNEHDRMFRITSQDDHLYLDAAGTTLPLTLLRPDTFYASHSDLARLPLHFEREDGQIVGVWLGADWYSHNEAQEREALAYPPEWDAYVGRYMSHNPWSSDFSILIRRSQLWIVTAGGDRMPLVPLSDGAFRLGPETPERIRFGAIVNGESLIANLSGCEFYRGFQSQPSALLVGG